jgi:hypothetical protein
MFVLEPMFVTWIGPELGYEAPVDSLFTAHIPAFRALPFIFGNGELSGLSIFRTFLSNFTDGNVLNCRSLS